MKLRILMKPAGKLAADGGQVEAAGFLAAEGHHFHGAPVGDLVVHKVAHDLKSRHYSQDAVVLSAVGHRVQVGTD